MLPSENRSRYDEIIILDWQSVYRMQLSCFFYFSNCTTHAFHEITNYEVS
jgi:hypothetical protein